MKFGEGRATKAEHGIMATESANGIYDYSTRYMDCD